MKRKFRKKIYVRLVMQDNMCFKCWKINSSAYWTCS